MGFQIDLGFLICYLKGKVFSSGYLFALVGSWLVGWFGRCGPDFGRWVGYLGFATVVGLGSAFVDWCDFDFH